MPDHKDSTQHNGEAPFEPERLLRDLKAMPRVSAPMDFSYHLSKAIEKIETRPSTPWWKRLFIPAAEGGYRIPGIAYGAVTVMVVLFFSVYVFKVTDFDRDLRQEIDPDAPVEETIPAGDAVDDARSEAPSSLEQKSQGTAVPEAQPAAPATDALKGEQQTPVSESAGQTQDAARQKNTTILPTAVPAKPQSLEDVESELRLRGFLEMDKQAAEKDSSKSDSLRRLDSIRRQKIGTPEPPPADPR